MREPDWDAVRRHEDALLRRALDGLRAIDGVTLYGDAARPHADADVQRRRATSQRSPRRGSPSTEVAVWHGNYYAWELERFLGLAPDGAVRAGFVHYNDADDADRLVAAVAALSPRVRSAG